MKNKSLIAVMLLMALLRGLPALTQVNFQPLVPQVGLVQKSQLWSMTVTSLFTGSVEVTVTMELRDRVGDQTVLAGQVTPVTLQSGAQALGTTTAASAVYTFLGTSGSWPAGGLIPAGLYRVCYQIRTADAKNTLLAEECVPVDVEALVPPQLVYPEDSASLNSQYPQFIWLPPAPLAIFNDLQYDLNVVEVLPGQSAQEAVQRNMPVYTASGLTENTAAYASSFSLLDTGRWYAWQVVCRNGYSYGAKSEAWVFRVLQPRDSLPSDNGVFLQLDDQAAGGVHSVTGNVLFVKYHSYDTDHEGTVELFGKSGEKIRQIRQRLRYGGNYFAIRLPAGQFTAGDIYTLKLKDSRGQIREARFTVAE